MDLTKIIPEDKDRLKILKALTDPLRLRLFYFFYERHTVKEAAEAFGVKPNGLYHHLSVLKNAGLVEVVDKKKVRNLTVNYYKATKDVLLERHKTTNPEEKASYFEIIMNLAWSAYEDCCRELTTKEDKKAFCSRFFIKIKKEDLGTVPKKIAAASKEFEKQLKEMGSKDGDVRYSVTILEFEMSD